jgi:hypothetical protein
VATKSQPFINTFFKKHLNSNNESNIRIFSSISSGFLEVLSTHSIDVLKTKYQLGQSTIFGDLFKGLKPKMCGIIPMRLIFWTSKDWGNKHFDKYNCGLIMKSSLVGIVTGSSQSLVDHPMELLKVRMINSNVNDGTVTILKDLYSKGILTNGLAANLIRNIHFAAVYNLMLLSLSEENDTTLQKFSKSAVSGLVASITSQPWDYIKTVGQAKNKKSYMINEIIYVVKNEPSALMKGCKFRSTMSFIGMGIGFVVYEKLKEILTK